jgi:hypothetical protein
MVCLNGDPEWFYFSLIPVLLLAEDPLNFAPGGGSGLVGSSGWPLPPQPLMLLIRQIARRIRDITGHSFLNQNSPFTQLLDIAEIAQ